MSGTASKDNLKNKEKVCRVVIQQCQSAELKFDTEHPQVSIGRGIVVFVCFLQGATRSAIEQIGKFSTFNFVLITIFKYITYLLHTVHFLIWLFN